MKTIDSFESKVTLLKSARMKVLSLHKVLIDIERNVYEKQHGQITSGQFLNLLVNDENFQWLRSFSVLIVEIDEMLDLDDGYTISMVDNQLERIRQLVNLESDDEKFKARYQTSLQENSEAALKNGEIKDILN